MTVKPSPPIGSGQADRSADRDGSTDMASDPTTKATNWFVRSLERHPQLMMAVIGGTLGLITALGVFLLMFFGTN
jgi:hypothetical protein